MDWEYSPQPQPPTQNEYKENVNTKLQNLAKRLRSEYYTDYLEESILKLVKRPKVY
jgi:hypothetical protein